MRYQAQLLSLAVRAFRDLVLSHPFYSQLPPHPLRLPPSLPNYAGVCFRTFSCLSLPCPFLSLSTLSFFPCDSQLWGPLLSVLPCCFPSPGLCLPRPPCPLGSWLPVIPSTVASPLRAQILLTHLSSPPLEQSTKGLTAHNPGV